MENHCVSVKGAEGQSDFFLGGDGRGGARVRASRGERGRERREGRTSSASRKASRKKWSVGRVRAMVVSGGVGFGRVHACLRGTLWLPEARRATEKKSWFLVTRCGSGIDRDARVLDASDASRSEPLAPGPRRKRAHRTPKLASSTDTFSQTLVKSRRFFPRGAHLGARRGSAAGPPSSPAVSTRRPRSRPRGGRAMSTRA